ncbi:hypothetical protein F2Q69_00021366 [Brassica cretica]|uniref:Uncharacterized protein n=1 Tax=Brassica cretica TaxID=69181 RepID=A0A3N6R0N2_BRACR|nr:hypothetical protein F2Q69_00021366 [Brassica cretica]
MVSVRGNQVTGPLPDPISIIPRLSYLEPEGFSGSSLLEKMSHIVSCSTQEVESNSVVTLEPYQVFPAWDGHEVDLSTCIIIKFQRS